MSDPKAVHGICHCAHPDCKACQGKCKAPGTTPVSIKYKGERKGQFRLCEPCIDSWRGMDDIEIEPQVSLLVDLT
jgi:hypothetical protein